MPVGRRISEISRGKINKKHLGQNLSAPQAIASGRTNYIANKQYGNGDSKYVVIFDSLPTGHMIQAYAVNF